MDSAALLAFLAAAVPSFFTPGPNNLMLMASGARFGITRTLPHMFGIVFGFPLMVFVVGLGLGEVFTAFPWLKTVLKFVAAAYFLWLAWHLIGIKIGDVDAKSRPLRFIQAALFQWVNPKAWAMAVSFTVLMVVPGDGKLVSLAMLTIACVLVGSVSAIAWLAGGSGIKALLERTGGERYVGYVLAALMVVAVILFLL
ncbi:LysE family translocator [Devosia sp.]|uniref:LysE family translocator n=1 Tax=Devosia sp. TaxID=1871048 RepID=UPI003A8D51A6